MTPEPPPHRTRHPFWDERPSAGRLLWRAARLRCPRCGRRGLFTHWLRPRAACPTCGLRTERGEHDYYLGAMMFNLIAAEGIFVAVFAAAIALTWPDPPWPTITVAGIATMVVAPFAFYPFSKTLWLAVDLIFRPVQRGTSSEEADPSRSPPRDEQR